MRQAGDRVGAISHSKDDVLYLFGYGVYEGDFVPDPSLGVRIFGDLLRVNNPQIRLDSGKLVYGCECWWGAE